MDKMRISLNVVNKSLCLTVILLSNTMIATFVQDAKYHSFSHSKTVITILIAHISVKH
jgi:hypothetical protein